MSLLESITQRLNKRQVAGTLRALPPIHFDSNSQNSDWIDFASNDYLGLATLHSQHQSCNPLVHHPTSYSQIAQGATGSRLLTGNNAAHQTLELDLAQHFGYPAALLFNSGYDANVGLFSSLPTRHDTILYDEYVHASMRDGIRLSMAQHYSFRHNDLDALESKLKRANGNTIVAIESIYSMDGDSPSIPAIDALCTKYGAQWIVDEAHAIGVIGPNGKGLVAQYNDMQAHLASVITFSKAYGTIGAAVLGPQVLVDFLVNFSRAFIYTTALPPFIAESISSRLPIVAQMNEERDAIKENVNRLKALLQPVLMNRILGGDAQILSILTQGNAKVRQLAQMLHMEGLLVYPILSPTVPIGLERLRICVHSFNQASEIEQLADFLINKSVEIN